MKEVNGAHYLMRAVNSLGGAAHYISSWAADAEPRSLNATIATPLPPLLLVCGHLTEAFRKVKLSLYLSNLALRHEDVWGSGCKDPRILDLGTSWRWVVSFTLRPLYLRDPLLGG
jgi:hypothetical protein